MALRGRDIVQMLRENDKAVGRALLFLYSQQTADEQAVKDSKWLNRRGFRPQDAKAGSTAAEFFEKNGYLTEDMLAYWRGRTKEGMRIAIYWKQLLREAYRRGRG